MTLNIIEENKQQNKELEHVESEPCHFTINKMQLAFTRIEAGLAMFEDMDPNAQRFSEITGYFHEAFALHNVMLSEKKRVQGTLDHFFKRIKLKRELPESTVYVDINNPRPSTSSMYTPPNFLH